MGENSLFNCDLFKWFNNRLVNSHMEGKKVTQFTWIWNLNYKFQLETLKIQILYKEIEIDTLITCKPKMVSILSQ